MEDYMREQDWRGVLNPKSIGQQYGIARRVLGRMPPAKLLVVALSTGGTGSYAMNLSRFRYAFILLRKKHIIFDSSIFDESLRELARQRGGTVAEQSRYVMRNFYVPLMKSGRISSLICMSDLDDDSVGSNIARAVAKSLNLPILNLREDFFPKRPEPKQG
jgi:hypothetical protein